MHLATWQHDDLVGALILFGTDDTFSGLLALEGNLHIFLDGEFVLYFLGGIESR